MAAEQELLEELRPVAFGIAYRMLGSVASAEDCTQEALLRLHQALERGDRIASPRAYVSTIVTRLAIDELRSARVQRERYVGEWLPEPLLTGEDADPAHRVETTESLSFAFMLMLERLTPGQRAAFLLREAFDYSHREVAAVLETSEDNARQLVARARRHLGEEHARFAAPRERHDELVRRFFAAAEDGDTAALEALLSEDAVLRGDGGGKVPALARAIHGAARVARTLAAWSRTRLRVPGTILRQVEVNGGPGVYVQDDAGRVIGVMALEPAGDRIGMVGSVVNPDKLRHLGDVHDFGAWLRAGTKDVPGYPL